MEEDMGELDLHPEWAVCMDLWRGFISGQTSKPWLSMKEVDVSEIKEDDDDDGWLAFQSFTS